MFLFALLSVAVFSRVATPLDQFTHSVSHGSLQPMPGSAPGHLLKLSGSPYERGFAHGYLLAPQIIDWLVFYLLETNMGNSTAWYNTFSQWWLNNQFVPEAYAQEVTGMLDGMKRASGDFFFSLYVDELSRDFDITDIYVINAYLEATPGNSALTPGPFVGSPKKPACSQFVIWGKNQAGTIAGRNMDGECDPAPSFITTNDFIVMAVAGDEEKRFISFMWPGHIGGLSLINEDGLFLMLNCGSMGFGPVVKNLTGIEVFMRTVVSTMSAADASPAGIKAITDQFKSAGGGISGAGSVIVFARPSTNRSSNEDPPGFVLETDRFGSVLRVPNSDEPSFVAQTNHFIKYGVNTSSDPSSDPLSPWLNFGLPIVEPGVSSFWRLEAILEHMRSRKRVGLAADLSDAQSILQRASHGSTEHSVGFSPDTLTFSIGVARPEITGAWDAPYESWHTFTFEEIFRD
jgi:hypothetical protein